MRSAMLASVLYVAMGGLRVGPPPTLEIDGYLDRAPEGAAVADTITIRADERRRVLVLVSVRNATDHRWVRLREGLVDYGLIGPREEVDRIFSAPAGARIYGRFVWYGAGKRLYLRELLDAP